jgi:hypothetical protein
MAKKAKSAKRGTKLHSKSLPKVKTLLAVHYPVGKG